MCRRIYQWAPRNAWRYRPRSNISRFLQQQQQLSTLFSTAGARRHPRTADRDISWTRPSAHPYIGPGQLTALYSTACYVIAHRVPRAHRHPFDNKSVNSMGRSGRPHPVSSQTAGTCELRRPRAAPCRPTDADKNDQTTAHYRR